MQYQLLKAQSMLGEEFQNNWASIKGNGVH